MISRHLILVSAQAVPNLTPVLDERFKPREVIMLVSQDMVLRASWLEQIIKKYGVKTRSWEINDPWDIEYLYKQIMMLMERESTLDGSLALNATGGTKPMSIAAYRAFQELQQPIFYVHPEQGRVIWMHPAGQSPHKLAGRILLQDFLQAYGATVLQRGSVLGVPAEVRALTTRIIERVDYFGEALSSLNYWAGRAEQRLTIEMDNYRPTTVFWELIGLFENAGFLKVNNNVLSFPDESARFFVNGGWLETHVYGVCLNLKKPCMIQDVGRSITVERLHQNKSVKNELDVAFLKDNRLYLLECKTKVYAGKHSSQDDGAQALYKLDTLKDLLGGLQAKAMLISFAEPSPYDVQRAGDLKVALCCYKDLRLLPEKLQAWIK